jgi:DNA-binding transcriptional MerR regulator
MNEDQLLSISDVGAATGLRSSALRYYERAGLIQPAARIGGRRHYSQSILHQLAIIALLQDVGFTISEIEQLIEGKSRQRWRELAEHKVTEIDAHIERVESARNLLIAALGCKCGSLEECEFVKERSGHRKAVSAVLLQMGRPPT